MYLEKYNYKAFSRNKIFKSTYKAKPKHKLSQKKLMKNYQSKR